MKSSLRFLSVGFTVTFIVALILSIFGQPSISGQNETPSHPSGPKASVTVASKNFTEGYVLAEILSQVVDDAGETRVKRKFGLGGTGLLLQSILSGKVDLYPEYTGTLSKVLLKEPGLLDLDTLTARLDQLGLVISKPLGFNNTFALAVRREYAERNGLRTISDLAKVPKIRAGFGHEFVKRPDGLPGLRQLYGLSFSGARSLENSLVYEALANGQIDISNIFSTDAKVTRFDLRILEDDRSFFPKYFAVIVARKEFVERHPHTWQAIQALEGTLSEDEMRRLNTLVDIEKTHLPQVAHIFLKKKARSNYSDSIVDQVARRTREHIKLVFIALSFSIAVGVPLGILGARQRLLGQTILLLSGMLQTIPSLALLCFLIPIFGIGMKPALVALFLYGLLPIVTGTTLGLQSIDSRLIESAKALGLSWMQRLRLIQLPIASPNIIAGIRTSVVINIGTATLAALIGAGGYGAPIVTGLAMNDNTMILLGAIPAAVLALIVHGVFEIILHFFTPKGLRIR